MPQRKKNVEASRIVTLVKRARRVSANRKASSLSEVFVCQFANGAAHCVHLQKCQSQVEFNSATISKVSEAQSALSRLGKRCPIIAVLPKSLYLTKTLETPKVSPHEAIIMLSLEIEGMLPREFGAAQISYRLLSSREDDRNLYEVYISRLDVLKSYFSSLVDLGLRPDIILPSAAIWSKALATCRDVDLFVVFSNEIGEIEAASLGTRGEMLVRSFRASDNNASLSLDQAILECIRAALPGFMPESLPLTVGWIGDKSPSFSMKGYAVFRDVSKRFMPQRGKNSYQQDAEPLVYTAASSLLGLNVKESFRAANLLPREVAVRYSQRSLYKKLTLGATCFLFGVVLVYVALQIGIIRYRKLNSELSEKIALIRTKGQAAGRRIAQLKAIRAALVTKNDFYNVISGLYGVTPDGVTYSHVEMKDSGEMNLRGQARSVSLPFLLPEKLESDPMFGHIVLQSVGQKTKGSGSVTEFRLDCYLKRGGGDD